MYTEVCILIRTYADLTFSFLSAVRIIYDLFQLSCVISSVFICFPPEVIFRSRVIGACTTVVTTDCIVSDELMWQQQQQQQQKQHRTPISSPGYHDRKALDSCLFIYSLQEFFFSIVKSQESWSCCLRIPSYSISKSFTYFGETLLASARLRLYYTRYKILFVS